MRGYRITWRGGFTAADNTALQALHQALQTQHGWTALGAPVVSPTAAGGKIATAHYEQAILSLRVDGDIAVVEATVWGTVSLEALKRLAAQTFGMRSIRRDERTDYLLINVDEVEL